VDIHGQSEHLSLFRTRQLLNLLDRYGDLWPLRERVADLTRRVRAVQRELADLMQSERELAHRADLLQFQIGEIEAAALEPDEETELLEERLRLANAEQLAELAGDALGALEGGNRGTSAALDLIGAALRALEKLARVDPSMEPQLQVAEGASYQIEELGRVLRSYHEQIEYNPRRLRSVEDRLALIRRLERKYGGTVPDVLAYAAKAAQELDAITHSEERIEELQALRERLLADLGEMAVELSARRREAARRLAVGIEEELGHLRMEGARFDVGFEWHEDSEGVPVSAAQTASVEEQTANSKSQMANGKAQIADGESLVRAGRFAFDATGIDRVAFLVSPNPGEPLKPMAKIASGGETSRLMLALKTVLSRADETPTLIFDEIDQGIGGRVGATVGEKLWGLAEGTEPVGLRHQVLCVTHLPQLAAFGDVHFRVAKGVMQAEEGERTVTRVQALEGRAQVEELAQMLGASGKAAYQSAEEILAQVAGFKSER
jgi:DNA repair protein RecN (Recombination protein N)